MHGDHRRSSRGHHRLVTFAAAISLALWGAAIAAAGPPAQQGERATRSDADELVSLDGDWGLTHDTVLACRTAADLAVVSSSHPENRPALAVVQMQTGRCTRLAANTMLSVIEVRASLIEARVEKLGKLWIERALAIDGLASLQTSGTLAPEPTKSEPKPGLTAAELDQVKGELAGRETVPGAFGQVRIGGPSHVPGVRAGASTGGRRGGGVAVSVSGGMTRCRCANGQIVHTKRSGIGQCDDACGVQSSEGSERGCNFRGLPVSCKDAGYLDHLRETGQLRDAD